MPLESPTEAGTAAGTGMPSILEKILAGRRVRVAEAQRRVAEKELHRLAEKREPRDFFTALRRGGVAGRPAIIAELKKASPSRGVLREDFDIPTLAASYERGGAAALSVLTEEDYFHGRLDYLAQARMAATLPILRKDFIFCNYQIWEAAAHGADAVLLIAAMLTDAAIDGLRREAARAGLDCLVEVHNVDELHRVLSLGFDCIGVNNRDLHTFNVSTELSVELAPSIPRGKIAVAESGLRTGADLARMTASGYQAVLIGESFMQSPDPGAALARTLGEIPKGFIKICGTTNLEDAQAAVAGGADAIGFVLAESPRRVAPETAAAIAAALPRGVKRVGVFVDVPMAQVTDIAAQVGLDAVQLHGRYDVAAVRKCARSFQIWRAVGMPASPEALTPWRDFTAAFVLDTAVPGTAAGGTGKTFAWELAPALVAAAGKVPVLVAGGLRPDNIAAAIAASGAAGVDVASGVEAAPGRKDHGQVTAFLRAAKAAYEKPA